MKSELLEACKWMMQELCEAWDEPPEKAIPQRFRDAIAKAEWAPCCKASRCHVCKNTIPYTPDAWEVDDEHGKHRVCSQCFEGFAQAMNDSRP